MTDDTMPFLDALLKRGGGDFMKELAEEVLQRLMAYDVDGCNRRRPLRTQ